MAKKKAKVPKRRHDRRPIKQNDDPGVQKRQAEAVVRFDKAFRMATPSHAASGQSNALSSGNYVHTEGDDFDGKDYPIADGRYRVAGSDWIHTFEGGGYVESEVAQPPDFGGRNVIGVDPPSPGNG